MALKGVRNHRRLVSGRLEGQKHKCLVIQNLNIDYCCSLSKLNLNVNVAGITETKTSKTKDIETSYFKIPVGRNTLKI